MVPALVRRDHRARGWVDGPAGVSNTRGSFPLQRTMAVAYIQYHWKFQIGDQLFPAINKGELALLYTFVFLLIACRGGVKWSLDKTK